MKYFRFWPIFIIWAKGLYWISVLSRHFLEKSSSSLVLMVDSSSYVSSMSLMESMMVLRRMTSCFCFSWTFGSDSSILSPWLMRNRTMVFLMDCGSMALFSLIGFGIHIYDWRVSEKKALYNYYMYYILYIYSQSPPYIYI